MKGESKRILIALLRFHGDIVLITPLIAAIKRLYPKSKIDLLVYKGTHRILDDDTRIDEVFEANLSSKTGFFKKIFDEVKLYLRLRSNRYHYGVFLTTQWRMAFISRFISPVNSTGVSDPKRRGSFWTGSFNYIFPEVGEKHILERNLSSLSSFGLEIIESDFDLSLFISDSSRQHAKKLLNRSSIPSNYCIFHPVSRREPKLWRKERFSEVADFYSKKGINVILTSGPEQEEIDYLSEIENRCEHHVTNLGGETSLTVLAALIEGAEFFIGLDSVSSHLSAAVGTPSVTLFGPSSSVNWKPWSKKSVVITRTGSEEYCEFHGHLGGKFKKCLCYISSKQVIDATERARTL